MLDDVLDKEAGLKPKLATQPAGVVSATSGSSTSGSPISASAISGAAIRHIPQADLDAYINGQLSGPRLDFCRTHLDSCDECRAALEDLRNFKSSQAGRSMGGSLKRELDRRKRQKQLKAAATAATVAGVVAAVAAVGWFEFVKPRLHVAAVVASGAAAAPAQNVAQAPAAGVQAASTARSTNPAAGVTAGAPATRTASSTASTTSQTVGARGVAPAAAPATVAPASASAAIQPASTRAAVAPAPSPTREAAPAVSPTRAAAPAVSPTRAAAPAVSSTRAAPSAANQAPVAVAVAVAPATGPAAAAPAGSTTFALLGPFGSEIADDRPEFTWQPLAGAAKYAVILVDEGLRPIAHARVKTTSWRPRKPLRRGRTYLWQVTAILHNGTKVIGAGPTSAEARIHIALPSGAKHADE